MDIAAIQEALKQEKLDGWLFYYFHENDPIALRILGLSQSHFFSRRWFYFIPASGGPVKLVHKIESESLDSLPGDKMLYVGWKAMEQQLQAMLDGCQRIAMHYSPRNAVPYVSRVDAGMVELVRTFCPEVASAANLISRFESTWSESQLQSHLKAAELLRQIVFEAFEFAGDSVVSGVDLNEFDIQQFIWKRFMDLRLVSNSPPIVAVNEHSGQPHYQPTASENWPVKEGDLLLIDLWARPIEPADSVYADITWTGFMGDKVPAEYTKVFNIVAGARDCALDFVRSRWAAGEEVRGFEVDDAARGFIEDKGYGDYFIHRTGHSVGVEVHANGANIDNLETRDDRRLIPRTCFSIEPGIYLPEFGIRSEIDVYLGENQVLVAGGPIQTEIIPILALPSVSVRSGSCGNRVAAATTRPGAGATGTKAVEKETG